MGFAVFHASKGSGSGGGTGHHIDRTPGHEHTYPHTDPSRRELNENRALGNGAHLLPLPEAITQRIQEGYQGKKAIRKDAVKYLSLVLTGSHEDMVKLASEPARFKQWQQTNFDFVAREFGEANIMRFTLHLDEKTPHIHAVVVPLTEDGRLSAKDLMGNKKSLSLQQDRYAEAMEPFELSRGVRDSKARHTGEGWYLEHLKEARESQNKAAVPEFTFKDRLSPEKYVEGVKTSLTALQQQSIDLQLENKRRESQVKDAQAKQQHTAAAAARQKEAVQAIAEQLVNSGKEGITLNASYALNKAPAAIKEAASIVFTRQVKELAETHLKSSIEPLIRQFLGIEKQAKPTQQDYGRLQELDTPNSRQKLADYAMETFNHEVSKRWGVSLNTKGSVYLDLARKALKTVNEAMASITQEVKKALGLDKPQQQNRGRGIGR
ncbi:MobV family relaxase [Rufibacter sp. XAAS-G3-1]|uniref:MobV family relaxase n=1 Tax=Rufibacter sp. XAAS-G3-1 TaxID=2729134 RepID=UPI0015E68D48|nr:MobV family relaxase [Rufibacter sp. XAAS-G3-1]